MKILINARDGKILEIPFNTMNGWIICNHDGQEWIAEKHKTWR